MRAVTGLCCALVLWAAAATAQVATGPEFVVNSTTYGSQYRPLAAVRDDGSFVAVWTGGPPSSFRDGWGRRFDPSGAPVGEEFRLNHATASVIDVTDVAGGAHGDFVAVWHGAVPGAAGIFARRFDEGGRPQGTEFQVHVSTTGSRFRPRVDRRGSGPFVITWWDELDGGGPFDDFGVAARLFDSSGRPLGPEFRVNSYTTGYQYYPDVAVDASGRFVVVWGSRNFAGGRDGIFARTFEADGTPSGAEFQVNTTTGIGVHPSVAWSPAGGFVVAWTLPDAGFDIRARRLDDQGHPIVNEFTVNEVTTGVQFSEVSAIAPDGAGNFVVTWSSGDGGMETDVFARRFDALGNPRGPEFRVNTYTSGPQREAAVASDAWGNFLVGWSLQRTDGTYDAAAQRFGGLLPAALDVDREPGAFSDGNGVFEGCETVAVEPTWRNRTGASQAFTAAASLSGPPGGDYILQDPSAQYGTVPDAAAQRCTDCYLVSACARPLTHWDATLTERLIPDAQGQVAPWRLHVGESFLDVPRTSPFYRSVETVLHHGITAGCSANTFCPGAVTTREQMAVFVLLAREGAGYLPSACTTPLFADVPASSPFCRWIEELARRGVVSGCGGGNYCSGAAVTREQMAVFVLRTLDPALAPPACTTPVFADVPASSPFCPWIEELARRQVVSGCGGGRYCPAEPVTREQMGVFVAATFGLALYGP